MSVARDIPAPRSALSREGVVNAAFGLGLLAVALLAYAADEPFVITLATRVAILALAGVGLNLVLGYGGLVSFGHAAFFGLGGYAAGILASHALTGQTLIGWPVDWTGTTQMLLIWPVAIVVSALAAVLIGALSLRTTGIFFIMITLAFGQMFYYFMISWPAYGGEDGLPIYVRSQFPGLNTMDPIQFFGLAYGLLLGVIWLSWRITGSRFGLALQAARQNRQRLQAVGIRPFGLLLTAFAISGGDHRPGRSALCRPQPLRQSRDDELAHQRGADRLRHTWRRGAPLGSGGGGSPFHRAGAFPGRGERLLAVLPRADAAARRAVRAGRTDRNSGGAW